MPSFLGPVFRLQTLFGFLLLLSCVAVPAFSQSGGRSGTISGTVSDGSGAVVVGAAVSIENPVSGYRNASVTDSAGHYEFANVPFDSVQP